MGFIRPILYGVCRKCGKPYFMGIFNLPDYRCPRCNSKKRKNITEAEARHAYLSESKGE